MSFTVKYCTILWSLVCMVHWTCFNVTLGMDNKPIQWFHKLYSDSSYLSRANKKTHFKCKPWNISHFQDRCLFHWRNFCEFTKVNHDRTIKTEAWARQESDRSNGGLQEEKSKVKLTLGQRIQTFWGTKLNQYWYWLLKVFLFIEASLKIRNARYVFF